MRRLLLGAVCALSLLPASPALASLTFDGDFETGDDSQWTFVQTCPTAADRVMPYTLASQPTFPSPFEGSYSTRLKTAGNDNFSACNATNTFKRAQVATDEILPKATGSFVYEGFSLEFPSSFPTSIDGTGTNWMVVQQDFGFPFDGSPPIAFDIADVGGVQSVVLHQLTYNGDGTQGGYNVRWSAPLDHGTWHRFVVKKKMSDISGTGSTAGQLSLYYDGVLQTFTSGTRDVTNTILYAETMDPAPPQPNDPYLFYLNSYRGPGTPNANVVHYVDDARVGTTLADVCTGCGTADVTDPTTPGSWASTGHTSSSTSFSWTPSTDNVGIDHYNLWRQGVLLRSIPGSFTTWTQTGLLANTAYNWKLEAVDYAGNVSPKTAVVIVTTDP